MNGFKDISELPKEFKRLVMILDHEESVVEEIYDERDKKRWFMSDDMGAWPIDEIEYWRECKFDNVSCSSCGDDFGQGDSGFSHCDSHAGMTPI